MFLAFIEPSIRELRDGRHGSESVMARTGPIAAEPGVSLSLRHRLAAPRAKGRGQGAMSDRFLRRVAQQITEIAT
jgi:hypothetical protein